MALLAVGRKLPVLRDLSLLVAKGDIITVSSRALLSSSASNSNEAKDATAAATSGTPPAAAGTSGAPEASSTPVTASAPSTVEDDEDWTEVVHSSGQLYYWNQRTGQTTQLGEPKPQSNRGGRGAGAGAAGEGASVHDPRAEAPLEDRTGTYAAMGVFIGAFLGWVSQFV